jgi:hypothetical protein
MFDFLQSLLTIVEENNGINDKARLTKIIVSNFNLTKDRSVFYCRDFAVRFSSSNSTSFSNTVLSLSNLQKVDDRPVIVCLVTPTINHLFLANSSFLKKVSHTSQELRENNIRGSFNGSDIMRELEGIKNVPSNFERLYNIHAGIGFETNLPRLVESTTNISPTGIKFNVTPVAKELILKAPQRASKFILSQEIAVLKKHLDDIVSRFKNEILLAALIENVNVRGRIIEYLIAGDDKKLRQDLIVALKDGGKGLPQFKTENSLGDYTRDFEEFFTETDVKTKIMTLSSNPKAYNLDKMLEFLSSERSVFMFYFVGVDPAKIVDTVLISMFQIKLLKSTVLLKHWAGRNSRGVAQFEGKTINGLIRNPEADINEAIAVKFLEEIIAL